MTVGMQMAEHEPTRETSGTTSMRSGSESGEAQHAERAQRLLVAEFGDQVKTNVPLAPLTSARIGGAANVLISASSADHLETIVTFMWRQAIEFVVLGGGSNVLVGDKGIRAVTIINRAKRVRFHDEPPPNVWAESGVVFSNLANRCALKGLSGLEWAASVPGTIGGAAYGNAGAFGGDMASCISRAEVLTRAGRQDWTAASFGYGYRTSVLKRHEAEGIVLSAELRLQTGTQAAIRARMAEFAERRKSTQPPGASMGSMFKNPPGDKAGRLIEAAGLKGKRVGTVEISRVHANFFVNHGRASADDVKALIELVRNTVRGRFGIELELEIELIGE